ncbi:MAG: polysaccharide pyruvyl transferase family protein, partial [Candidatus Gracilibacteria bacterium]|nr:polysaccharide pyruvyl transferase family protein [Candidatus Gracilibacteria bacterium]
NEARQSFDTLLLQWRLRVWIAKLFRKPILYWSLGIHIKAENEAKILPLFEGKNTYVSVRDTESRKILENLGIKSTLIFDPVLLYDPEIPQLMPKKRPKVGLSFRAGYLPNALENIEKIITFLGAAGYEVILLNHSFHTANLGTNDSYFLSSLAEKYQLRSTTTIQETLELYKELEFVIGMRLHSLILAFVHTIPFFAISYSQKTDEFIRSINYDFSLAARVFDIEVFKKQFHELESTKNEQKFALERKNDTIKREVYLNLNYAFDGLDATQK